MIATTKGRLGASGGHSQLPSMRPLSIALLAGLAIFPAFAGPREAYMAGYAVQAGAAFDADRGKALFLGRHAGGGCTDCHDPDPAKPGRDPGGHRIAPMALSAQRWRYSEWEKMEMWFDRDCRAVLQRPCTALEKGDFVTFMSGQ